MPAISFRTIDDVEWNIADDNSFSRLYTHVWKINIPVHISRCNDLKTLLNKFEEERADRYRLSKDRDRFIISRGWLKILLAKYAGVLPDEVEFLQGADKKPHMKGSDFHYNVSHSGDWILIAISGRKVGIDIEYINPEFAYNDILDQCFSSQDAGRILTDRDSRVLFYNWWTRKEALLKSSGKGLDDDLPAIPCADGQHLVSSSMILSEEDVLVGSFRVAEGYVGSIACIQPVNQIAFWDVNRKENMLDKYLNC
ncbi:MAG: 4'-phosphopantetheinyl transferase superfamily protein [Taibaiella sp.]|nr:4'-phosphopantetheinyl transferase superfamily protein [Taibaiella sp.]